MTGKRGRDEKAYYFQLGESFLLSSWYKGIPYASSAGPKKSLCYYKSFNNKNATMKMMLVSSQQVTFLNYAIPRVTQNSTPF